MPELPEVETVRRSLVPHLCGRRIEAVRVRDRRLRFPVDVRALKRWVEGRAVLGVRRRAKYLLVDLEAGGVMLLHLGMTGRLGLATPDRPFARHDHVVWDLDNGQQLRFNDARRFGLVAAFGGDFEAAHPRLCHLGVEPLGEDFSAGTMFAMSRGLVLPVKSFLMDAARVAGVGNIYACEALFRAGVDPRRRAGSLVRTRWARVVEAVRATLTDAIEQGGTTLRNFFDADGAAGYFAIRLRVYGRHGDPCVECGRPVRRLVQCGRSTFFCPRCQT